MVEEKGLSCDACLRAEGEGKKEPLIPFPAPHYPFQVVDSDLFSIQGSNYLMVVDYLTKWPAVITSSRAATQVLREMFSDLGIPQVIVSDNGPQHSGSEFRKFCAELTIQHRTSSPLYSSGNVQVEQTIGTVKGMMKKCMSTRAGSTACFLKHTYGCRHVVSITIYPRVFVAFFSPGRHELTGDE